ncbi:MAG: hypothetical protein WCG01_02860 [bacterium]
MITQKYYILVLLLLANIMVMSPALAEGEFNPNYIIDDTEINDYSSLSRKDIQEFLDDRGGFIASYRTNACTDEDIYLGRACSGEEMSTADIIFDRAINNKVNPKFFIVLLQKEQSLIEKKTPTQNQLDWALGYGCYDNQACFPRFRGFWKQLNSASLQFRDYMDSPDSYTYRVGQTYTISNSGRGPSIVTPQNQATCSLYNYTPHVYNGNFNFYNIWQRYFTRNYPNGSLVQVPGEKTVWVIQDGRKRAFKSRGALMSRYDVNKILNISKVDLDKYLTGSPINFAQYAIVRAPSGALFLLVNDTRRGFASQAVFRKMGYNPEEIVNGSWNELNSYKEGAKITASSTYLTGALLQDKKTGGIYWVVDGTKAPLSDRIYLTTMFKGKKIIKVSSAELNQYQKIEPVIYPDGELIKTKNKSTVYVISDGQKRSIESGRIFESLKYNWKNVIIVPDNILYYYPDGEDIKEKTTSANVGNSPELNLNTTATSTATISTTTNLLLN